MKNKKRISLKITKTQQIVEFSIFFCKDSLLNFLLIEDKKVRFQHTSLVFQDCILRTFLLVEYLLDRYSKFTTKVNFPYQYNKDNAKKTVSEFYNVWRNHLFSPLKQIIWENLNWL